MFSKLAQRFRKDGSKSRSGLAHAILPSTNHSSAEMEPLTPSPSPSPKVKDQSSVKNGMHGLFSSKDTFSRQESLFTMAYSVFLERFPLYTQTHTLDTLREREFKRIQEAQAVYMDYMGACIYPDFLVQKHLETLTQDLIGNTHSDSPSSTLSERHVSAARQAVLSFFNAPSEDYVCIFTPNCTGALKLVGESFPFDHKSRLVLAEDSHNSVNGIRKFAESKSATVHYVPSMLGGGFEESDMLDSLQNTSTSPSLLALTGQSNISGFRPNLPLILSKAKKEGYYTLLDAAALASTSSISLDATPASPSSNHLHLGGNVDALAISFYKMFGYPTGVGALIARKDFLQKLNKPWFSGGTVEVVGFPSVVTESKVPWERFEEGTMNYAALVAIPAGLDMLKSMITGPVPILPLRLGMLHTWLHTALESIRHTNGMPVVRVLTSNRDTPRSRGGSGMGYILSLTFHESSGARMRNAEVSSRAAAVGISLRTGCVCNPGGAVGLLGLRDDMVRMQESSKGVSDVVLHYADIETLYGQEVGVVRLSLGLVSSFRDVWEVERFVKGLAE